MTGLIGWWPLHETRGDTAYDLSGNGNDASVENNVFLGTAGNHGLPSYKISSDNDGYVEVLHDSVFEVSEITISYWLKIEDLSSEDTPIQKGQSGEQLFYFRTRDTTDTGTRNMDCLLFDEDNTTINLKSNDLEEDKWYHFVATYSIDGPAKLYQNNSLVDIESDGFSGTLDSSDRPIYIGAQDDNSSPPGAVRSPFSDINIQDVRIYNRPLTASEIRELYLQGSRGLHKKSLSDGSDIDAVSRWKLDNQNNDANEVLDVWGSNNSTDVDNPAYSSEVIPKNEVDNSLFFDGDANVDGDGDIVERDFLGEADPDNTSFTVSLWFNIQESGRGTIWNNVKNDGDVRAAIGLDNSGNVGASIILPEESGNTFGRSQVEGAWMHATLVWDVDQMNPNNLDFYINGDKQTQVGDDTTAGSFAQPGEYMSLGMAADDAYPFNGYVSDVRIFDRALEPWEVFELYRWGSLGKDMRKELVNAKGGGQ